MLLYKVYYSSNCFASFMMLHVDAIKCETIHLDYLNFFSNVVNLQKLKHKLTIWLLAFHKIQLEKNKQQYIAYQKLLLQSVDCAKEDNKEN